jgi:hypothetical protein
MFNAPTPDDLFWPANMPAAAAHFYGGDIGPPATGRQLLEQWLSLETPAALLRGEAADDKAVFFHRCLGVLNVVLEGLSLSRADDRLRAISARELRPIVNIGALTSGLDWYFVGPMLMHSDAPERTARYTTTDTHFERLGRAINSLLRQEPFIATKQWAARARRREYEGDAADAVISFQVAAETLLYDLLGMLMVDDGKTASEILRERTSTPFKSLLHRHMPRRLGGDWNLKVTSTAPGRYWQAVYATRNRIVHEGYQVHDGDSEAAKFAYVDLSEFIDDRLWEKRRTYPRTMYLRLGPAGVASRGSAKTSAKCDQLEAEPAPYYLPKDQAGR